MNEEEKTIGKKQIQKWEYEIEHPWFNDKQHIEFMLSQRGSSGWELAATTKEVPISKDYIYIFKRPIP